MASETQCFQYDPRIKRQHTNEIKTENCVFKNLKFVYTTINALFTNRLYSKLIRFTSEYYCSVMERLLTFVFVFGRQSSDIVIKSNIITFFVGK